MAVRIGTNGPSSGRLHTTAQSGIGGRLEEARTEFVRAAELAGNEREKAFLMERSSSLARNGSDAAG